MCRFYYKPITTITVGEQLVLQRIKGLQKIPKVIPADVVRQQDWIVATGTLCICVGIVGLGKLEHFVEE